MNKFIAATIILFFCLACIFLIVWGAVNKSPETMAMGYTPLINAGVGLVAYYFGQRTGEVKALVKYNLDL